MLGKKEKLFARLYSFTRNESEAAALMGLKNPETAGAKLLSKAEIRSEIGKLCREPRPEGEAAQGLRRIAFGSVSDAIKLLRDFENIKDIEKLDLYCISEIKFGKTGGMEIKFFDRIKALEKLESLSSGNTERGVAPFVDAVRRGAESISFMARGDDDGI